MVLITGAFNNTHQLLYVFWRLLGRNKLPAVDFLPISTKN